MQPLVEPPMTQQRIELSHSWDRTFTITKPTRRLTVHSTVKLTRNSVEPSWSPADHERGLRLVTRLGNKLVIS